MTAFIAASAAVAGALFALLIAVRRTWVLVTVAGHSMTPTFRDGERLLARRLPRHASARASTIARGDVVVFRLSAIWIAEHDAADLPYRVKRVAAIAGDALPPWAGSEPWAAGATHVPPDMLVVAGDNRHSQGSRELGYIAARDTIAVIRGPRRRFRATGTVSRPYEKDARVLQRRSLQ